MPKSKYVTITLTQHEAEMVRDEIEMASLDSSSDSKRRADLGRAHNKITAAYVCGHNSGPNGVAPANSLIGKMARALQALLNDGDARHEGPAFNTAIRAKAEELIVKVQGKGAGA